MTIGYDKPLYVLPFDHRATFSKNMFGWKGELTTEQTAEISAVKQVIYDAFQEAVAGGVPKERAGILVDEQFAWNAALGQRRVQLLRFGERDARVVRAVDDEEWRADRVRARQR